MLNSVNLVGRLTAEPECMQTQNGKLIVRFTLAVNRNYRNEDGSRDADFISCTVFGNTADYLGSYGNKGDCVAVTGALRTGSYTDREGIKRYTTNVMVSSLNIIKTTVKKGKDDPYAPDGSDPVMTQTGIPETEEGLPF